MHCAVERGGESLFREQSSSAASISATVLMAAWYGRRTRSATFTFPRAKAIWTHCGRGARQNCRQAGRLRYFPEQSEKLLGEADALG